MKISYDQDVDAAYIPLDDGDADGVVEISEGISVDIDSENRIIGIEILKASKKISLESLFKFEIEESALWKKSV